MLHAWQTYLPMLEISSTATANINLRHRSWLKRKWENEKPLWKPQKRFWVSTVTWIASLDNQLATSTLSGGWDFFRKTDCTKWAVENWRNWPFARPAW